MAYVEHYVTVTLASIISLISLNFENLSISPLQFQLEARGGERTKSRFVVLGDDAEIAVQLLAKKPTFSRSYIDCYCITFTVRSAKTVLFRMLSQILADATTQEPIKLLNSCRSLLCVRST
jgi:hypothetical protein